MVNYYNVAKGVEPKRKKVAEAEKNLRLAQKDLAQTKDQLAALNSQLADLRTQFANKTTEQQVRPGGAHACPLYAFGPGVPGTGAHDVVKGGQPVSMHSP